MDTELFDLISRTRPTILEILNDRGYNVSQYENTSPTDLVKMAATSQDLLRIRASQASDKAPTPFCNVLYWVEGVVRHKVESEVNKLYDEENPNRLSYTDDDTIVLIAEPFHESFNIQAIRMWAKHRGRISFFQLKHLVSNPRKHTFVPEHRKLTAEEATEVMERLHIRHKNELPRILYHIDTQARVLGLVPGDIVEIRRPSPTCAEYILYRVCTTG